LDSNHIPSCTSAGSVLQLCKVSQNSNKPFILNFYETLHSCSTQPADVHEGIPLLSKIPNFEHHSIASGGYHSVRSLTVLVLIVVFSGHSGFHHQ
jgi:hypothetical protein